MRRTAIALSMLLVLTACDGSGGDTESSTSPSGGVSVEADGTQVVDLRETDQYRFTPDEPHVDPGKVRIDFTNTSTTATHSLAFKSGGPSEEIPFVNPGDKQSISFEVANPGKYDFFCTFHEPLGQRGVLVVDEP